VNSRGGNVGLDVHARFVVGCGLEGETGRVCGRRLTAEHREVLAWIATLPPPAVVRYGARSGDHTQQTDQASASPTTIRRRTGERRCAERSSRRSDAGRHRLGIEVPYGRRISLAEC
jgi:hypothetical protein